MDILPFLIFLILPFVFLLLSLRSYGRGYENFKMLFYMITFVCFAVSAMMFIMHGEDGVILRVFDPPSTVSTLTFRCDDTVQVSSTVNATGKLIAFPLPSATFPDGNYAFDSVLTALCYGRSAVGTGLDARSVYLKTPFDYTIQIPNTVDTAINQVTRNVQGQGYDFVSPYDEKRESDIYFLIDNRGAIDYIFPIAFLYSGFAVIFAIFGMSEVLTLMRRV